MDHSVHKTSSPVEGSTNKPKAGLRFNSQNNRPTLVILSSQIKSGQIFPYKPTIGPKESNNNQKRNDEMNISQRPV